jgi:hypothetical protein
MTSRTRTAPCLLLAAVLACAATSCAGRAADQTGPDGSTPITGVSEKFDVSGVYQPIAIDRVDGLGRENGRVIVKGPSGNVPIDVPANVDMTQPNQAWRLVTESTRDGRRYLTFTHETTLDNFTIDVPDTEGEMHYGAFLAKDGGSVLIIAWGVDGHSYWGWVTVKAKST